MSYSSTAHKIPDCMTRFWHANRMTSFRGYRTPLLQYLICVLVHNADNATLSNRTQLSTSRDKNYRQSGVECNN